MDALTVAIGVAQAAATIALAPLLTGIMRKVKARTQKRVGASVLQPYYDLSKLMKKDEVVSDQSSWVFRSAPWVMIAATMTAALFVPAFLPFSPFGAVGDVLVVLGLFGLARFFTLLAGLDVASAFGGLGASREMMISSLAEPALFLSIFVVSLTLGGTNLSSLVGAAAQSAGFATTPSMLFALITFFIVALAETGRLPFDNPATHLELTMVHEAMVLEYSGKSLAMVQWSQSIKQLVLLALLVNLFIPAGMLATLDAGWAVAAGAGAFLAKVVLLAILVAYVETRVAKWRLFRVPDLLVIAIASSMIGVIFYYL
ncbi:respiratory chain complex I subunit 1 family protein [Candidatus Nitrososphaera sp. FF02]|uniref:respiratory chain complex I subunit 1 family protein n=1 Tax=Candidatus Nitrososphaera sp. FF02 TaxID=3398226 RepID=UPI0039E7E535